MINYVFKRSIFRIREMAFGTGSDTKASSCDVVYMHSNDVEVTENSGICKKQYTLVTDLTIEENELLSKIKKNCRYEIRRAEREEAIYTILDAGELKNHPEIVDEFEKTYNKMFEIKGLEGYSFNKSLVKAGINAGAVVITKCQDKTDVDLVVYHLYLSDFNNSVLVYSASPVWDNPEKEKINSIGRMNKYLHWKDMLYFKSMGCQRFEWGGITDPDNPNGIDKFKMEFGGDAACFINYIRANSLIGNLYLFVLRRRERK